MSGLETIRVLIVDDHFIVRTGLAAALAFFDDLEIVGQAKDGEAAVAMCAELEPDVVLMDVKMPHLDGIHATRRITEAHPDVHVLILTSSEEIDAINAALQAGATGYLMKDVDGDTLAEAIRSTHAGQPMLAPEAARALIEATRRPPPLGHDLTEREMDVLRLLVKGWSNTQIAENLTVSPFTVKNHVSNILSKLGVSSRVEAATLAVQHQLVQVD